MLYPRVLSTQNIQKCIIYNILSMFQFCVAKLILEYIVYLLTKLKVKTICISSFIFNSIL